MCVSLIALHVKTKVSGKQAPAECWNLGPLIIMKYPQILKLELYISAMSGKISLVLSKEPEDGEGHCAGGRDRDHQGRPQLHAAPSVQGYHPSLQGFTSSTHIYHLLPKRNTVVKEVRKVGPLVRFWC